MRCDGGGGSGAGGRVVREGGAVVRAASRTRNCSVSSCKRLTRADSSEYFANVGSSMLCKVRVKKNELLAL